MTRVGQAGKKGKSSDWAGNLDLFGSHFAWPLWQRTWTDDFRAHGTPELPGEPSCFRDDLSVEDGYGWIKVSDLDILMKLNILGTSLWQVDIAFENPLLIDVFH